MNLTAEQILALAPDASAAKAGSQQAAPAKWSGLGRTDSAVWGECQGSGKDPYRTQIDLGEPAFKCSCPSRKFPCKHGLGLYLLLAGHPPLFSSASAPQWVTDWLDSRQQRSEKKRESASEKAAAMTPEQIEAQAGAARRREDKRDTKVARGLEELQTWLEDLAREGLSSLRGRGPAFWEAIAARMVDAQAGALASRLRRASGLYFQTSLADRETRLARELASLYLLVAAAKRLIGNEETSALSAELPVELQADIRSLIGWNINQDELLAQAGVADRWQVLAQRTTDDERVKSRATWLRGAGSGHWASVLHFAVGTQGFDKLLAPGTEFDGELVYYPGAWPQRALIKNQDKLATVAALPPAAPLQDALNGYTEALAVHPFLERFPVALDAALPRYDGSPCVQCSDGRTLPIHPGFRHAWQLLALSGGHPLPLVGEWDGHALFPLSVWTEGRLHNFDSDSPA